MRRFLEICIDEPASARAAATGGADRLEVCSALAVGGLTPSLALVEWLRAELELPLHAMVRPRAGGFVYSSDERRLMLRQLEQLGEAGCTGVVFGALTQEGEVDFDFTAELVAAAGGLHCTFHRAIDCIPKPAEQLERLARLGIRRVLSSGGRGTALEGADELARMAGRAPAELELMAGAGVHSGILLELLQRTGVSSVHASAARAILSGEPLHPDRVSFAELEGGAAVARRTSALEVQALRELLDVQTPA